MGKDIKTITFVSILEMAVLASLLLLCEGCDQNPPIATVVASTNYYGIKRTMDVSADMDRFRTVVIDGCEYLYQYAGEGASALTHKGNCTNSIHIYRAEDPERPSRRP